MSTKPDSIDNGIGATELSADRMSDREELASLVGQLLAWHWLETRRGPSAGPSAAKDTDVAPLRKPPNSPKVP